MRTWIVLHLAAFVLVFVCAPELVGQAPQWAMLPAFLSLLALLGYRLLARRCRSTAHRRLPGALKLSRLVFLLLIALGTGTGALHGGLRLQPYSAMAMTDGAVEQLAAGGRLAVAGYFCALDFDSERKLIAGTTMKRPRVVRICFDVERSPSVSLLEGRRILLECSGCARPQPGQPYQLQIDLLTDKRALPVKSALELRVERYRALSQGGPVRAKLLTAQPDSSLPARVSQRLRAEARQALMATVADSRHLESYHALFLGDRTGFSYQQRDALSVSGLSHLMVISGLHVGLMAGFVTITLRLAARLFKLPAWRVPVYLGTVLSLLGYLWLVDYAVPVLRATIMALLFIALTLQRRRIPVTDYWLITLTACLFFDPFAFISAGFWLSFGAVAVIALVMSGRLRLGPAPAEVSLPTKRRQRLQQQWQALKAWLGAFWRVQWQLFATLSVLLAVFFQQVSLAGLITNLVAIPLVTLLLVPVGFLALLSKVWAGSWPLVPLLIDLTDTLFDAFWVIVNSGEHFPVFTTEPLSPGALGLLLLLSVPTLWCWHMPFSPWLHASKLLLLTGMVTATTRSPVPAEAEVFRFIVFDVGQGHAALLDDGETTLLFDTGPVFPISSGFSGGRLIPGGGGRPFNPAADQILPYLTQRTRGTEDEAPLNARPTLDYLVVSHADHDHAGGTDVLLQHLDVSRLVSGEPDKLNRILAIDHAERPNPANPQAGLVHFTQCLAGRGFSSRGYRVETLWPLSPAEGARFAGNDLSCVLRVTTPSGKTIMLTGDIEKPALQAMVRHYNAAQRPGSLLDVDILVLPHHGSRSSFLPAFISAVTPEQAIVPAGANNRFGHPHSQPIDWLTRRGVEIWNTGTQGYYEFTDPL
ncbi:DNA internalization-related competence protein ComEC/Rec2 [Allohahella sp. A8]|uniref:DNA internalization-related competence protein ComEC/Rec2 n=1 Tax=Allohahella sp. A8 TaxID=3141461 RepID=UPI003A7FB4B8